MSLQKESLLVALIILCVLGLNLLTASRSPTVWLDEVSYSDPAVNLATGKGFVSSAWYGQSKEELWAGNVPLHALLLAGWLKCFDFGIVQVRSLNYFLIALAAIAFWWAFIKGKLFRHASTRIGCVLLLLNGYGMSFCYRSGRPDCIVILLFSLMFLGCSLPSRRNRYLLLGLSCFLLPAAGLQGLPLLVACATFWLILKRTSGIGEFLVAAIGSSIGLIALLGIYWHLGVLDAFIHSTLAQTSANNSQGEVVTAVHKWASRAAEVFADHSLVALWVGLFAVSIHLALRAGWHQIKMPRNLLLFCIGVATLMLLAGKFPVYYAWMAFVPAVLAWGILFDKSLTSQETGLLRWFLLALACLVALSGLPLRLALTIREWNARDYEPVKMLALNSITASDVVFTDVQGYYATKPLAKTTYSGSYSYVLAEKEKLEISVLLIDPVELKRINELIGGGWSPVDGNSLLLEEGHSLGARKYRLQLFRRLN